MKFYDQPSFKKLNAEWRKKLVKEGFEDLEDPKERLKTFDRRTQSFDDRDQVEEFFHRLSQFLLFFDGIIPSEHWEILDLYSRGEKLVDISKELKITDRWVKKIVANYRFVLVHILRPA